MAHTHNSISTPTSRRHRWFRWLAASLLVLLVVSAGTLYVLVAKYALPVLRGRILRALSTQFQSNVSLGSLNVSVQHGFDLDGQDLRIQPKALPDYPPVITVRSFSCHLRWRDILERTLHIRMVHVEGLKINIPPKAARNRFPHRKHHFLNEQIFIDRMECDHARLQFLTDSAEKIPLRFQVHRLVLLGLAPRHSMQFTAQLLNPRPKGEIHSQGRLGPWDIESPGLLPLSGQFSFQNADLSTTKGIQGTLSSQGNFHGTLENIQVDGSTDTPNFRIDGGGTPIRLQMQFHAVVDGTSGNTILQPVLAQFLHSSLVASGQVMRVPNVHGCRVMLNIQMNDARIEDLLHLGVKVNPPALTGRTQLTAKFDLEPGKETVMRRVAIQSSFHAVAVRFTSVKMQDRIDTLSLRAQGKAKQAKLQGNAAVDSQMQGTVMLKNDVLTFHPLQYQAPGMQIHLNGTYALDSKKMNMDGTARLDATVSQTMTGIKSFLLKPLDRFFEKNGTGTEVAIKISGTEASPKFTVARVP